MRTRCGALAVLSGWILCSAPARGEGTWLAIPGRPDVPVFVNPLGFDASNAVVERDFGLDKPAMVDPHIVGPLLIPIPMPRGFYFPHTGRAPGYGRYEIQPSPHRQLPPPAPSYQRWYGAASDPLPASTDPPYPITVAPQVGPWGPRGRGDRPHDRHARGDQHDHGDRGGDR
jgi:hypothetical protein